MTQQKNWNREYAEKKMITGSERPQAAFLTYLRYLRKSGVDTHRMKVLDLGSGTGRNSIYLAGLGNEVTGIEFSANALKTAEQRARAANVEVKYLNQNIGQKYPLADKSFDLVLDITSSNALTEAERAVYLAEVKRVLRPGGLFFVRTLSKDGDKNAQNLLRLSPGKEVDTYYMKELGLTERVFSREDFIKMYGAQFKIQKLIKATGHPSIGSVTYKRNYLIGYLQNDDI